MWELLKLLMWVIVLTAIPLGYVLNNDDLGKENDNKKKKKKKKKNIEDESVNDEEENEDDEEENTQESINEKASVASVIKSASLNNLTQENETNKKGPKLFRIITKMIARIKKEIFYGNVKKAIKARLEEVEKDNTLTVRDKKFIKAALYLESRLYFRAVLRYMGIMFTLMLVSIFINATFLWANHGNNTGAINIINNIIVSIDAFALLALFSAYITDYLPAIFRFFNYRTYTNNGKLRSNVDRSVVSSHRNKIYYAVITHGIVPFVLSFIYPLWLIIHFIFLRSDDDYLLNEVLTKSNKKLTTYRYPYADKGTYAPVPVFC